MKKILSTLVVAGAMLGFAAVSFGQAAGPKPTPASPGGGPQGGPGGGAGMRQRMMKVQEEIFAKLNLNAKQKDQLKAFQKKNQDKMKALRDEMQKNPNNREAMRPKMQAFRKEQQDGLKKILTADQFKKFETLMDAERKKMRAQFGGGPGGRPGGPGFGGPGGPKPGAGAKTGAKTGGAKAKSGGA